MFIRFFQRLKRRLGLTAAPLATFTDISGTSTVRYELFSRFISRISICPRDPESAVGYFMSGLDPDPSSISKSICLFDRDRSANEKKQLDEFLNLAVACVKEFRKAGIPAFAPMATPGINDTFFTKGQEFITGQRIPVFVNIAFHAPTSGGRDSHLPAEVRIRVSADSVDYNRSTSCEVLEPCYSALELQLVGRKEMAKERYAGYSVSIRNEVLRYFCVSVKHGTATGSSEQAAS